MPSCSNRNTRNALSAVPGKPKLSNSRLAHEVTRLLISIQEGSGTKNVNRARKRWKACEASMIQRPALRERRGVKKALNPEHLGEGKGQHSKCHRDEPVENDDWFTQSNHTVLYAANQEYPSPECQRLCVILAVCDLQEHTAEVSVRKDKGQTSFGYE